MNRIDRMFGALTFALCLASAAWALPVQAQVPTEAPAQVPTEAPAQVPTEAQAQVPTEAPAQVPTEAPTEAQTHDEDARVHFQLGRVYYDSGRFEDAAHEFQQAYDLSQRNGLLYNLFVAWRDAGQLGPAITALRQYIASVAPGDRERFQAQVRNMERVYRAQQRAGVDTITHGSSADTTNDGSPSPAINDPATDESHGPGAAPWILMGSGGALLVGGALTGIMALSAQSDLKHLCDANGTCPAGWESTRDRGQTLAVVTDVLMIGGGLVVAGGLLWLVLGRRPSDEREPSVALVCAPGGCAASARFVF